METDHEPAAGSAAVPLRILLDVKVTTPSKELIPWTMRKFDANLTVQETVIRHLKSFAHQPPVQAALDLLAPAAAGNTTVTGPYICTRTLHDY